jgi:hypothetical protein
MNKKIAWEKISFDEENDLDPDQANLDDYDEMEDDKDFPDQIEMQEGFIFPPIGGLFNNKIKTPIGYYAIDDQFAPHNMFDCWVGHTNFPICENEYYILDNKIDGLGCFKVLSKYRFFIGIEKMFSFTSVRCQIQKELCNNLEDNEIISNDFESNFQNTLGKINETFFNLKNCEKWAIFIGHDGSIETISNAQFSSEDEYEKTLKVLKSLKDGNIITCDNV